MWTYSAKIQIINNTIHVRAENNYELPLMMMKIVDNIYYWSFLFNQLTYFISTYGIANKLPQTLCPKHSHMHHLWAVCRHTRMLQCHAVSTKQPINWALSKQLGLHLWHHDFLFWQLWLQSAFISTNKCTINTVMWFNFITHKKITVEEICYILKGSGCTHNIK